MSTHETVRPPAPFENPSRTPGFPDIVSDDTDINEQSPQSARHSSGRTGNGDSAAPQSTDEPTPKPAPKPQPSRVHTSPIPTLGWPAFWYKVKKLRNPDPKRPRLSSQELERDRAIVAKYFNTDVLEAQIAHANEYIDFLMALGLHPVVSFCNIKSGSKTTVALYVSSIITRVSKKLIVLLPTTQNTATSTIGMMAGVKHGKRITVRELNRKIDELGMYLALSDHLPRTKHGLGVIMEDENIVLDDTDPYAVAEFDRIVRRLRPNVDLIVLDHGNDNIERESIGLHGIRLSDVVNFTCMLRTPISKSSMQKTIHGYFTDTVTMGLHNDSLSGERISTIEKVRRSNAVASGWISEDGNVDFDELTRPIVQSAFADPNHAWQGVGHVVPFDEYIADPEVSVCDLDRIAPETYLAYASIAISILEEAAALQGVRIPVNAPVFTMPSPPADFTLTNSGELVRTI